jgi:hypothetical protein
MASPGDRTTGSLGSGLFLESSPMIIMSVVFQVIAAAAIIQ